MGKKSRAKLERREQASHPQTGTSTGAPPAPSRPDRSSIPAAPAGRGSRRPRPPSPTVLQAQQLLSEGKPEAALDLLRPPVPHGQEPYYRDLTAYALVALHQYDQAYPLLTEAAGERGMDYSLYMALAETEANLELIVHAERRIRLVARSYPNEPGTLKAREFAQQVQEQREALAQEIGADPTAFEEAMFLIESNYIPYREGNFQAVIETSRRALGICPGYERARFALANALLLNGEVDEAVPLLQQMASAATAEGAHATQELVHLYCTLGRVEEAREVAAPMLDRATTPETRLWEAETLACLGDHEEMRDLLSAYRDLNPRERFLLGVASANLRDVPTARRQFEAAIQAGYREPTIFHNLRRLEMGNTDLQYLPALEWLSPQAARTVRSFFRQPGPEQTEAVRALIQEDPQVLPRLQQMLEEDPGSAIRILTAAGSPEAIQVLRDFAFSEEPSLSNRLVALSALRDLGEIAEDEPIQLNEGDQTEPIVLGKHKIIPDRLMELPDQEAATLFEEGIRLLENDLEGAYDRWVAIDERFPRSPQLRTQIARVCMGMMRLDESREWLQKALELDPDFAGAHVVLLQLCLQTGDLRGAMQENQAIEAADTLMAQDFLQYQSVLPTLNGLIESPLADALLEQADLSADPETAEASREMADLLGSLQKSLALTQYLRQRPVMTLREDLTLAEVTAQMDSAVIENAAWLFGLLPELDRIRFSTLREQAESGEEDADEDDEEESEEYLQAARDLLSQEMLAPERLSQGLPGLPDRDLKALQWLLDHGGIAHLDDYLREFPPSETSPGDMLLENGIVAEGRLGGRVTRLIPVDLRAPLQDALQAVLAEVEA